MIRRHEPDTTWVIHQGAHAYISGLIAAQWVGAGEMVLAPREELLLTAAAHDGGWRGPDQRPRLNNAGLPRTFTEMDLAEHFTIWRESILGVFLQNRYGGLLTSLHCTALYEQRLRYLDDPAADKAQIRSFLAEWNVWQEAQIAALADHPRYGHCVRSPQLDENLRLLQVWDYLSLLLCMTPVHEQVLEDVPLAPGERSILRVAGNGLRGMALDPYPLREPMTIWIDARQVLGEPFKDDVALHVALEETPYKPLVFEIGPL